MPNPITDLMIPDFCLITTYNLLSVGVDALLQRMTCTKRFVMA